MAYASLQSDFRYFVTSEGYIAYHCYRHPLLARRPVYIVVGDPVAPVSSFARLIRDFLGTAPHALFIHTSEDCAGVLDSQGLTVNQHGVETDLHLPHYDLRGKLKANLRHWVNTARKAGVEVIEQDLLSVDVKEVSEVSEEFLRRKGGRELALLTRPFEYREQPDVRFFWARRNGELLGFATFDPLYKNGRVYGYYRDITRCKHSAPNGTPDLITTTAIEQFKREGREVLKLGFSPLCLLADEPFHASRLLRWLFEYGYKYGELSYGFKGLAFHKKYYRGTERPVFVASTTRNNLLLIRDHTAYGHSLGMWAINRSRYFFSRLFSVRLRH
jgi:phosphatidylglycerol lysyltransferase